MRSVFLLIAFALISFAAAPHAGAQSNAPAINYNAERNYNKMAAALTRHEYLDKLPENFDYMYLRGQYSLTRNYDPLAENAIEQMLDLAYKVETAKKEEERYEWLNMYKIALQNHIANIGVVSQALVLARQNPIFGDVDFLTALRAALFDTVIKSGNGNTLRDAYDIITLDEEVILLNHLNYQVVHTDVNHSGAYYYNIHSVIEKSTMTPYTVFVNTTFPMRHLDREQEKTPVPLNLPKR